MRREGRARLWVRGDVAEFAAGLIREAGSLYLGVAKSPDATSLRGRDVAYSVPAPAGGRWMVRRLRHGGMLSSATRGLFLRWAGNRPQNELIISCALARRGIPTPAVVAAVIYPAGPFYRGEVAREFVEARGDLAGCLFDPELARPDERTALMGAAGTLVGNLHKAGLDHPDLNLRNILIVSRPGTDALEAWILDLEKCRLARDLPGRAREAMLARLRRSVSRFEAASGIRVSPSEWSVFMDAYREAAHA
jgi:3-deoxy-D-manno-octulosonic acid kinase